MTDFFILQLNQQPSWNVRRSFLDKYNKFLLSRFFLFVFRALRVTPWNVRSFLSLGLKSSISWNLRSFFWASFFHFLSYKSSVSWNIRKLRFLKYMEFFRIFRFPTYKESFLLKKYKKYFQSFHFLKYKSSFLLRKYKKFFNIRVYEIFSGWIFFIFRAWAEKCAR